MALKPLKDRVVAKKEQPLKTTKSGILLGEAEEKPAYAVVESVGPEVKEIKTIGVTNLMKIIQKLSALMKLPSLRVFINLSAP